MDLGLLRSLCYYEKFHNIKWANMFFCSTQYFINNLFFFCCYSAAHKSKVCGSINAISINDDGNTFFYIKENSFFFLQVELVKQTEEGDVSNYQANGEFDLVSFSSIKNIEFYSCCPEPYPDITYTIKLRRRPLFYVFNLILPCILINGIGKGGGGRKFWTYTFFDQKKVHEIIICIHFFL